MKEPPGTAIGADRPAIPQEWHLRLYILGQTRNSRRAVSNLNRLCSEQLRKCEVQVIDLEKNPELARADDILVVPTLIRSQPRPVRRVLGDLSKTDRVLRGLELR